MCAVSLAECALTTIAILGKNKNLNIDNATCDLQKIMISKMENVEMIHHVN